MKKKGIMTGLLLSALLLSGCNANKVGDTTSDEVKKEIVVGTSADYEPYEFKDEVGNIVGLDVDIIKAISEEKGYTLTFQDITFDELIPSLEKGDVDVVIAALSPTDERKKVAQFSDAYYTARDYLVFKEGEYTTLQEATGKRIAVQTGSTQEEYLNGLNEHIDYTVVPLADIPSIYKALQTDDVDAILIEDNVAKKTIQEEKWSWREVGNGEITTYAIAFPIDSPHYALFNDGIIQLKLNGTLDTIIHKWMEQ